LVSFYADALRKAGGELNEVVVHPGNIEQLFKDPAGPIGRYLTRRGLRVARNAETNFNGAVLGVRSGDLRDHFDAGLDSTSEGLFFFAGTTAIHDEFGYPRFHDREGTGGKPWLSSALRQEFPS
jgi:hypothetical protein